MRTHHAISRREHCGFALLVTLIFLGIMLAAYSSLMYWVSTNSHITKRNNLFNQTEGAAESATESVLAVMMRDFNNQSLNSAASYAAATNLPSSSYLTGSFLFSDTNGNANATTVNTIGPKGWSVLPARYNGLFGLGQIWDIASTATPQNTGENLSATVEQQVWFGSIPIFQFAIFYNMDLEINPGAGMTINGPVHSNNTIWATGSGSGASALTFSNLVDYVTGYNNTRSTNDPSAARSGNVVNVLSGSPAQGQALSMPIGTNNDPSVVIGVLGIPPASIDPASDAGQSYVYNKADLIVSNSAAGTNYVYYQNFNISPSPSLVPMDQTNIVSGTTNYSYSFVTNATFYDYREAKPVKAVQLNVGSFNTWLTTSASGQHFNSLNNSGLTSKGHAINGVYVYNSIPSTGSQLPAVRLVNGQQLQPGTASLGYRDAGMTVATPFPVYVKGDYNITTNNGANISTTLGDTVNTRPAAIMGDAVTVLSTNWVDTDTSSANARNAVATTINAATMEGIVPSNGSYYSGGVENFLRLLENWGSVTLGYNGSIVVLFQSQYATNPWGGSYYTPPKQRAWGFDPKFNQQSGLPPMTPQVRATIRESWAAR